MPNSKIPSSQLSNPAYRSDIDGLRAVAVLAVVGFHAFPNWVRGGFIGVDVFFVISGFLISTIIFDSLDKDNFSFSEFYSRRIKRIFPALLLVLLSCFAFGWVTLLADEYKQLGKHIAAGAGFVSNFILWNEAGYFDNSAETKPLLHLWSLGIEEQFYIAWPLLLWFAWKQKFNLLIVTVIVAVTTFILNLKGVKQDIVADFYSPLTRFWELLIGSLLAWFTLYRMEVLSKFKSKLNVLIFRIMYGKNEKADNKTLANILSVFGSIFLLYGLWCINKELSFPGKWALLPVIGAVLIIAAGSKAWINHLILSNKIAVWFGLISFPLYLWHWPIISFATILENGSTSHHFRILAVIISVFLSWVTFRYVERPVRQGNFSRNDVVALCVLMVTVGMFGYFTFVNDGFPQAVKGEFGHDAFFRFLEDNYVQCSNANILNTSNVYKNWKRCWQTARDEPDVILLGDSHAEHLFVGLSDKIQNKNIAFYIEGGRPTPSDPEFKVIFEEVVKYKNKYILITDHFYPDYKDQPDMLRRDLEKSIEALISAGHKVALVGDVPRFDESPEACIMSRDVKFRKINKSGCQINLKDAQQQEYVYDDILKDMARKYKISYFPISRPLCNQYNCSMLLNRHLYYRDRHHLNILGSKLVGGHLADLLTQSGFLDR